MAEVVLFDEQELSGGESAFAQLRLKQSTLVLPGDAFILRQSSPLVTIGGGTVLDPLPRRHRAREVRRDYLEAVEQGDQLQMLNLLAERSLFGLSVEQIPARTGWADARIKQVVEQATATGQMRTIAADSPLLFPSSRFAQLATETFERVEKFHRENPLRPGIPREELRVALARRIRPEIFRAVLDDLAQSKKVELQGEIVKRAGSQIFLLPEEAKAKDEIENAFASAGFAVPTVKEVLAKLSIETRRAEKLLQLLLREKALQRVTVELIFHHDALAKLRKTLAAYKQTNGDRISVPTFKDLAGISRKYAIPLLEYLDRERVTRRVGDERVIL